jgi:hypothetical protein
MLEARIPELRLMPEIGSRATFVTLSVTLPGSGVVRTMQEAAMVWADSQFAVLIVEVHRVILALDGLTQRDGSKAIAEAVSASASLYAKLLEFQETAWLTAAEANALQNGLDSLQARLTFFRDNSN